MRVAITGATGAIGNGLVAALAERGDEVVALSRDRARAATTLGDRAQVAEWPNPTSAPPPAGALDGCDAVVNLIGERIDQRWSDTAKRSIRDSRVLSTRNLVEAIGAAQPRPGVLVSQSGSDRYGARGSEAVDESVAPAAGGFLAGVVAEWEAEAQRAEELGARVVLTRTGVVLTAASGALAKMLPFFKLGVGGPVAGGDQYIPWIHRDDEIAALLLLLDTPAAAGPVNLCAPQPATNKDFSKTLGRALGRPAIAPVPALALRLLYGEMSEVVTGGVRLEPRRLTELGFEWRWPELEPALRAAVAD